MCLGIPGKVIKIKDQKARVDFGDHCHWLNISLLEEVKIGDYLLAYQDAAINKVDKAEALKTIALLGKIQSPHEHSH